MNRNPINQKNIDQAKSKIQQLKNQFEQRKQLANALEPIKTKIGVYSGKGGVGKTSVTINLALSLNNLGYRTGIGAFSFESEPPCNIEKIKLSKSKLLISGVKYLNFDIIHH